LNFVAFVIELRPCPRNTQLVSLDPPSTFKGPARVNPFNLPVGTVSMLESWGATQFAIRKRAPNGQVRQMLPRLFRRRRGDREHN